MTTNLIRRMLSCLALAALAGCATLPTGPSVLVLPDPGKPFEVFQSEDYICRQWANYNIGVSPQDAAAQSTASGAAIGTMAGAGIGAALGAAAGDAGLGAAIGGGSGLLIGTASGASAADYGAYETQLRYDNAYVQCMYAKGNQIPGVVRQTKRPRKNLPPPPTPHDESP